MSEGRIPVNASDLPIDTPALDESLVYDVSLKKVVVNPTRAKNDVVFCKVTFEVTGGDYEGALLNLNYLPLPLPVDSGMTRGELFRANRNNVPFGRFARAFKIDGTVPEVDLLDQQSISDFQDWIAQFYESQGKVTIRNQEYPEGSGKMRSGVNDFIF